MSASFYYISYLGSEPPPPKKQPYTLNYWCLGKHTSTYQLPLPSPMDAYWSCITLPFIFILSPSAILLFILVVFLSIAQIFLLVLVHTRQLLYKVLHSWCTQVMYSCLYIPDHVSLGVDVCTVHFHMLLYRR